MAYSANGYNQEHFTIIEVDIPVVNGTCTLGGQPGYGTALTCDQPTNATRTYKFTTVDAPLLPESDIWRCITSISEQPTELKAGRGLATRATLSVSMVDFQGDPNPLAPAVTQAVRETGGFLAKLDARNILVNREVRVKNYVINDGVFPNLETDADTRYYIVDSLSSQGRDKWQLRCKDELSKLDLDEAVWPAPAKGFLRQAANATQTIFAVDSIVNYTTQDTLRIGEELFNVTAVSNIGTGSATITATFRGSSIGTFQYDVSAHNANDEIFVCKYYNGARIDTVLKEILTESGFPASYIDDAEWAAEIDTWHPSTTVTSMYVEAEDVNKVIDQFLQSYMLDLWFDNRARKLRLNAVSVWQQSTATLEEGNQIEFDTVRRAEEEALRSTDALVVYDKRYPARGDAIEHYNKAAYYENPELKTAKYYSEKKEKRFANNPIIDDVAAQLLVRRYVSRYGITPQSYTFKVPEKKLNFEVGDVVDLRTYSKVGFDGLPSGNARAQVLSVKPNYNRVGRDYTVKALTYDPAISTDGGQVITEFVITGTRSDINLFIEAGGAIPSPVEITFIFKGTKTGSNTLSPVSIRAGAFPAGSKIIMILTDGADLQAHGGKGGEGESAFFENESGQWIRTGANPGTAGGIVYDAQGIDTDIYFTGATPSAAHPVADGFLRAPGGGGGSGAALTTDLLPRGGGGGGGGAGRTAGAGGLGGTITINGVPRTSGGDGAPGNEQGNGGAGGEFDAGNGGNWGQAGGNGQSTGGAAGSGIISGGATIQLFGATTGRYISGNGDV